MFYMFADAPEPWQVNFQDPATPVMEGIIDLHHDLVFFLIIILSLVSWMLLRTIFLFKWELALYVEGNPRFYKHLPSRITHNSTIEIIWTVVPSVILLLVGVPSFSLLYAMDELVDPELTIKIIGRQWFWSYEHRDPLHACTTRFDLDSYMKPVDYRNYWEHRLLETDRFICMPTKVHIRLLITSTDVLHSWAVPSAGIKLDACPGRLNQTSLYLKREGLLYGQCSELCGLNHAFMPIKLLSLRADRYLFYVNVTNWLACLEYFNSLDDEALEEASLSLNELQRGFY